MKLTILAILLVAVAVISMPSLSLACPPPPTAGFQGENPGTGPTGDGEGGSKLPSGPDGDTNFIKPAEVETESVTC